MNSTSLSNTYLWSLAFQDDHTPIYYGQVVHFLLSAFPPSDLILRTFRICFGWTRRVTHSTISIEPRLPLILRSCKVVTEYRRYYLTAANSEDGKKSIAKLQT